ncbi:MAG: nickel pincer cofactor biosynthesis protein LarC [Clostridia bacterium]|nr:nickel pincer cofactor biosynthesis protein LarC [Clostridia bacterium]
MKILYLDCSMGAAGDMLTASLLELLPDPDAFVKELNSLGINGVEFKKEKSVKCGITGTHISVTVHGEEEGEHHHHHHDEPHHEPSHDEHHEHHHHSGMHEIEHIISHLAVSDKIKSDVLSVYNLIAEAESHAHGVPVTDIHFHEVGTMDAVADVTAVCMLIDRLNPDKVVVSPIHVGSGQVHCAHGILPVPAPATAYILKDVPIYGGSIKGELCTPTGAALIKKFADEFGEMPIMRTQAIGYGMGKKDFEAANCVRAMLGDADGKKDVILELSCNVDDMTGEAISFAMDRLFDGGAREVYTIPIGMKKSRPGTLIRVMCTEDEKDKMIELLFKHTTTIGVRETVTHRHILDREIKKYETPYGEVRCKISSGYGVTRRKLEYDDLAKIAKEQGLSIDDVRNMIKE